MIDDKVAWSTVSRESCLQINSWRRQSDPGAPIHTFCAPKNNRLDTIAKSFSILSRRLGWCSSAKTTVLATGLLHSHQNVSLETS
ncbi:hypothetical protein K431DRAFT_74159 [Polychaeton citri CBS 116435]|uniref:Uncharacterized protein n=1 Tax=Polychaeton citri CBS 116435 TaxID=1314669 RepID=A0A9P4Q5Z1_9PEZI|nr:hypothetical protein K431DRAFT_74159 [Polychaeton citri CBS 116435]